MELTPGTIIDQFLSEAATPEAREELIRQFGLDRPLIVRYGIYMFGVLQGDLGVSMITGISVWNTYITRLPNTLALVAGTLLFGATFSIPLGIFAAKRAGRLADNVTTSVSIIGMSMPNFWMGLVLIFVFSHHLGWFPAGGNRHGLSSFILPAICSGSTLLATSTRQTRSSMLEVLKADYLRTARAKGVPDKVVMSKHALGNAWIPILTTIGASVCVAIAGSVVIESVFAWPGVGRMTVEAVLARDVITTTGTIMLTTVLYVLVMLIVDILYAIVDPRIRAQYVSAGKRKKNSAHETGRKKADEALPRKVMHLSDSAREKMIAERIAADAEAAGFDEKETERSETVLSKAPSVAARRAATDESGERDILVTQKYRKRSRFGEIANSLRQNMGAMAGLIILALLFVTFFISLSMSFESVTTGNIMNRLQSPSAMFPFGTDGLGRDVFLRVIYGTRYSLLIGFSSAGLAAVVGIFLGAIAGYFGKAVDEIIMRASDTLAAIPGLLLGMVIVTVLGQSVRNLIIAVGVATIPTFIRITRASILNVRNQEFVEAARAVGLSHFRIIFNQVLPNGLAPIIITFTTSLGIAILISSSLSFLGFGVPVPHPEWGAMIAGSRDFMRIAPWLTTFPGIFIVLTVLAFNLLGDGLRDALDPKLKK